MTVRIYLVCVRHVPRAASSPIVIGNGLLDGFELCFFGVECVAVFVLLTSDLTRTPDGIDLEDSVVGPVNVRVETQTEEMLVVMSIDAGINFGAPAFCVFAGV